MKYTLDLDPRAAKEAAEIYTYREREKKGSGVRFIDALVDCYASIMPIRTATRSARASSGMRCSTG
jgi:hypothetical protein